jgi:ATP-dependent DNA helicase PIF1
MWPSCPPADMIVLPRRLCMPTGLDLNALIDWVFPDLALNYAVPGFLVGRAILTTTNAIVDVINDRVASHFPLPQGAVKWDCYNADSLSAEDNPAGDNANNLVVPIEVLNATSISGMPPHKLSLAPGMPIMLLRNLNARTGQCNGTRLIVERVINGVMLQARIAATNAPVLIPRIDMKPSPGTSPYSWTRRQFPVRLAFGMTINKSQGQTLSVAGVYLPTDCFSHGQAYVAASRVSHPNNIRFAVDPCRTRNVVYREALLRPEAAVPAPPAPAPPVP